MELNKTGFLIKKMDCPAEENIIRMKLAEFPEIKKLDFDIEQRQLTVYHQGTPDKIIDTIESLNFDSFVVAREQVELPNHTDDDILQRNLLWSVLVINAVFFIIEMISGWLSGSMGLVADSLDMLADALVYGLSLVAVGGSLNRKKNIAKMSGYLQMTLAILGFSEVLRRFAGLDHPPDFQTMIVVSVFALVANGVCLYLLQKSRSEEAHMKASMIFTSNDVIINTGVILAGLLVNLLNSNKPDLIIGTIVFIIVIRGALRILKLGK
jgi:Co/Zn/Cd efflux system component